MGLRLERSPPALALTVRVGAKLTLTVSAAEAGQKKLIGHFTKALDYGNVVVRMNGQQAGGAIDLYDLNVIPTGPISIELEIVGKDDRPKGYLVGLDGFVLK